MGNGMNKVLPGLYVGNYRDSKDHQQLDKFHITHIIAIHDSPRRLLPDKHYLCVMAADTPDQNLSQYFSVCNDFIHAARLREGNVLIHCLAGMSRSVTVAVAYIMTATNLNWKEALKVVRAGRAVANPNMGFQTQLQDFEMYRLAEERRRLRERFPSTALEQVDRSKCMVALDNYEELLQNKDICEGNCSRGEKCPTGAKQNLAYELSYAVKQWKFLDEARAEARKGKPKFLAIANDFYAQTGRHFKFFSPDVNESFEAFCSKSFSVEDKTTAGCDEEGKSNNPNQQDHIMRQNNAGSSETEKSNDGTTPSV